METVESLKRRMHTAEDLHSLVRTMKALAAVNIRQAEYAVRSLADYQRTIELGLQVVLRKQGHSNVVAREAPQRSLGAIVIGSDQGMCGQLNDRVVGFSVEQIRSRSTSLDDIAILGVGARVAGRLKDEAFPLETTLATAGSTSGILPLVQEILLHLDRWHRQRRIDHIHVLFCEHTSRSSYQPRRLDLLPIDRRWLAALGQRHWPTHVLPTFTMDADRLFSALVRQYLFVSIYRACAESLASENASRLVAMQGAERNIGERLGELTNQFHQTRQMAITEELLDIVAGFEALGEQI